MSVTAGRVDDDSWDVTTSVGLTALAAAAARATETARPQPLIVDRFAGAFLSKAATGLPLVDPSVPLDSSELAALSSRLTDYLAVRTRCFDDFFGRAHDEGIGQAVILGAGLDTRAFRIAMPGSVYELDQPAVLAFKQDVLDEQAAEAPMRTAVPVDLRDDWPATLRHSGFDPRQPTAWLAEGLLAYLPAEAQRLLLARVSELSAPNSRFALQLMARAGKVIDSPAMRAAAERHGVRLDGLFYPDSEPVDVVEVLSEHGWTVRTTDLAELAEGYGRPIAASTLPTVPFFFAGR